MLQLTKRREVSSTVVLDTSRFENLAWKQLRNICKKIGVSPSKRTKKLAFSGVEIECASEIYALPQNVEKDLRALFTGWSNAKSSPIEALRWTIKFLKIHPLDDGNGRLARILFPALLLHSVGGITKALQISNDILSPEEKRLDFIQASHSFLDFGDSSVLVRLLAPHLENRNNEKRENICTLSCSLADHIISS